jgi:hypothetical protein
MQEDIKGSECLLFGGKSAIRKRLESGKVLTLQNRGKDVGDTERAEDFGESEALEDVTEAEGREDANDGGKEFTQNNDDAADET